LDYPHRWPIFDRLTDPRNAHFRIFVNECEFPWLHNRKANAGHVAGVVPQITTVRRQANFAGQYDFVVIQ
jgi:hypothetical protein